MHCEAGCSAHRFRETAQPRLVLRTLIQPEYPFNHTLQFRRNLHSSSNPRNIFPPTVYCANSTLKAAAAAGSGSTEDYDSPCGIALHRLESQRAQHLADLIHVGRIRAKSPPELFAAEVWRPVLVDRNCFYIRSSRSPAHENTHADGRIARHGGPGVPPSERALSLPGILM